MRALNSRQTGAEAYHYNSKVWQLKEIEQVLNQIPNRYNFAHLYNMKCENDKQL